MKEDKENSRNMLKLIYGSLGISLYLGFRLRAAILKPMRKS